MNRSYKPGEGVTLEMLPAAEEPLVTLGVNQLKVLLDWRQAETRNGGPWPGSTERLVDRLGQIAVALQENSQKPRAVATTPLIPELPGLDLSDIFAAGWGLDSYKCAGAEYVVSFASGGVRITCRGDGYPEAVERVREHLWREGLLAIRDTSKPDDIRAQGWSVAVHNDYRLDGMNHTFWLFTKDGRAIKGEGLSDQEALNQVRTQLK